MVLARMPRPFAEDDLPFEVYVGGGKLASIERYLARHPHPTYVATAERLRGLATGRFGERAGDVLLLAHNGDRDDPNDRYYFAGLYRSWHGSPSRKDSEIPFIVAHRGRTRASIAARTRGVLGPSPTQADVARLLVEAVTPGADAGTP